MQSNVLRRMEYDFIIPRQSSWLIASKSWLSAATALAQNGE
jgi:hypothetical protein